MREQEGACDENSKILRYEGRPVPEEPLRSLVENNARLREPAPSAAVKEAE